MKSISVPISLSSHRLRTCSKTVEGARGNGQVLRQTPGSGGREVAEGGAAVGENISFRNCCTDGQEIASTSGPSDVAVLWYVLTAT